MTKCIELAWVAKRRGDNPVGAIIVKDGQIIGKGIEGGKTHADISFHAEIEAIREATRITSTQDLSTCTLYTTHEPCIMCSYMIRHTGIAVVVFGLSVGDKGGISSKFQLLLDDTISKWNLPPIVVANILHEECLALHA